MSQLVWLESESGSGIDLQNLPWKLLILGFVVAAMLQPFNVMISAHEGLLDGTYLVVNKYFYQLTILISGFGSSFAYFLNYKFSKFKKLAIAMVSLIPFFAFSLITFTFDFWYAQTIFPMEIIFIFLQLAIMGWYFLQGGLLTIFLSETKKVKIGWLFHIAGLLFGYLFAYFYLNNYGLLGILIFCFVCLFWFYKFNRYVFLISLIFVCCIPLVENLFNKVIVNKMTNVVYEDNQDEIFRDKKRSFKKNYLKNDSKIIYYKFGLRGLTEVVQNADYKASLYVNKFHAFSYMSYDNTNTDRAAIYNELFTPSNSKAIIGVGGGRSLYHVEDSKISNLNAVEINKDTISFALSFNSAVLSKIKKINYLNLDGRFYIDTLKDDTLDVIIFEGATLQSQAFQNTYLKPNFLSNSDAIISTSKKLRKDGYLIFERTQMALGIKFFQYNLVMMTLKNLGFSIRALGNHKLKNFYIIANRESLKLNVVDNIIKNSNSLVEIPAEKYMTMTLKKMNQCPVTYNDNHPFISVFCKSSMMYLGNTPIILALVSFLLTLVTSIFYIQKSSILESDVAYVFMTQGLVQSLSFSFLQFKFESYLWDDNYTLIYLISVGLIFSFFGNLFFSIGKKKFTAFIVLGILFALSVAILPHINIYGIDSLSSRVIIITTVIFIINFFISGIFSNMLRLVSNTDLGKMLFWDSVGLFLGCLSNYFILRVFGLNYFSIYVLLMFLFFIYFILKLKKTLFQF